MPDGDCQRADGSRFAFWEREADPTKVELHLDGGACWGATSCLHDPDLVMARVDDAYDEVQTLFMELAGAPIPDVHCDDSATPSGGSAAER